MARIRAMRVKEEHRYGVVLALILVSLIFQLAAPDTASPRLIIVCLQGLTVLAALRASAVHQAVFRTALVLVSVAVLGAVVATIGEGGLEATPARIVSLMLVAVTPLAIAMGIVRQFRSVGRVTVNAMFGVLCIYLLIGMFFGFGYGIVDQLGSTSFFASGVASQSNFLYFSFATLTTVGYGDLVAATNLGHSLAIGEALIGQIYMVTVVSVIVGNLGRARPRPDDAA